MKKISILLLLIIPLIAGSAFGQLSDDLSKKYPKKKGHLHFSKEYLSFNYLKDTEERSDTIEVFNSWDQAMEIRPENPPKYLTVVAEPQTLPAGEAGKLIITYSGIKRGAYGFLRYNMAIRTNDDSQPVKTMAVNAYIEEDFSVLTEEEKANPPVLEIPETNFDFGTVKSGDKVKHNFVIRNTGKRDLIIRSTRASCGCTATEPEKDVLAPGEETNIGIVFDTRGRTGRQHKTVSVVTNDPRHSAATLHIQGTVE